MSTQSLTAKYRPQRFADVAGQDAVKAVLSRASAEDRIAPAYLFSGTRGVGKTTIARIMAKAINCETAPTAEPCNRCRHCKAITAGAAVDVVEIDAASNRGIDDARRLKEDIGYAPIECRYKVFIVDEAHMLTREAFNALLKTLEEPPGHATFILATTEPHKFPATIVSRCQHYTFKRLPQKGLEEHLRSLLEREGIAFEPQALTLIARRGAGSVRDSMSLLAQTLAMGRTPLAAEDVRAVLGLAGREVLLRLLSGVADGDCAALSVLLAEVLDQGLDLGFFLRELAGTWRDLFLLSQSGGQAAGAIDAPAEEVDELAAFTKRLSLAHIHACWQLTLEGQRRVLHSLEPAQALELLLFNMASLPRLLDLESPAASGATSPGPASGGPARGGPSASGTGRAPAAPPPASGQRTAPPREAPPWREEAAPASTPLAAPSAGAVAQPAAGPRVTPSEAAGALPGDEPATPGLPLPEEAAPAGPRDFAGFMAYAKSAANGQGLPMGFTLCQGEFADGAVTFVCQNEEHQAQLLRPENAARIEAMARAYFGPDVGLTFACVQRAPEMSRRELRDEIKGDPVVRKMIDEFGAVIVSFDPIN